jgi:uncharacterized protein YoxC
MSDERQAPMVEQLEELIAVLNEQNELLKHKSHLQDGVIKVKTEIIENLCDLVKQQTTQLQVLNEQYTALKESISPEANYTYVCE